MSISKIKFVPCQELEPDQFNDAYCNMYDCDNYDSCMTEQNRIEEY